MNHQQRQLADIQREEIWLTRFSTPPPDPEALERIKFVVRQVCEGGDAISDLQAQEALTAAKSAVRRELAKTSLLEPPTLFRPWAPVMVATAAAAFAIVTLWSNPSTDVVRDPELAAFIDVMARPYDDTTLALAELEEDIASITATGFYYRPAGSEIPSLFEAGDVLDKLFLDVSALEEEL